MASDPPKPVVAGRQAAPIASVQPVPVVSKAIPTSYFNSDAFRAAVYKQAMASYLPQIIAKSKEATEPAPLTSDQPVPVVSKAIPTSYFDSDAFRAAVYKQAMASYLPQIIAKSKEATEPAPLTSDQQHTLSVLQRAGAFNSNGTLDLNKAVNARIPLDTQMQYTPYGVIYIPKPNSRYETVTPEMLKSIIPEAYLRALQIMAPYKNPDGRYDLQAAHKGGVLDETITYLFGDSGKDMLSAIRDTSATSNAISSIIFSTQHGSTTTKTIPYDTKFEISGYAASTMKELSSSDIYAVLYDQLGRKPTVSEYAAARVVNLGGDIEWQTGSSGAKGAPTYDSALPTNSTSKNLWTQSLKEYDKITYTPPGERVKGFFGTVASVLVPGYYVATHWDELGTGMKALNIALDALAVVPIAGAAGRGARGVTVATVEGSRAASLARLGGAARGAGAETIRIVTWPVGLAQSIGGLTKAVKVGEETYTGVRAVIQNVRNVAGATGGRIKASLSSIETMVRPTKLPESIVTDAFHTIKIPLSKFESVKEALSSRAALARASAKPGNYLIVETGDNIIELRRSALMRKLGGGLAHATPEGEAFTSGLIVEWKRGMPLREQGLFMSPEPLTRFAEKSAFGTVTGQRSAIIITSPEFAQRATTGTKIYKGAAEVEAIYPVGTKIPAPKQKLFTRLGDSGTRVDLYLGKALTKRQILELKAQGFIESVKNLYEPAITVTSRSKAEVKELADILGTTDPGLARNLTKAEVKELADILGTTDPGLARNLRTVASDPDGMLRVLTAMEQPTVYRNVLSRDSAGLRADIQEVSRRAGESGQDTYARASREYDTSVRQAVERADSRQVTERVADRGQRRLEPTRQGVARATAIREPQRGISRATPRRGTAQRAATTPRDIARGRGKKGIKLDMTSGKTVTLTEPQLRQSYAWKQGFIYKLWYPPHSKATLISITKRPPFVQVVEGEGSAQRSLTKQGLGAVIVTQIAPMGIVSVQVVKRKGKPFLRFPKRSVAEVRSSK